MENAEFDDCFPAIGRGVKFQLLWATCKTAREREIRAV